MSSKLKKSILSNDKGRESVPHTDSPLLRYMNKPKVLVIVGPTASGKTSLSIALAQKFSGEVISADSRQVYRKLDIGTAKVTPEEMDGVTHHLIDVADVQDVYTAADFKTDSQVAITRILGRDKLPIIAGGTFFYVDILLGKSSVTEVPPNPELRAQLEEKDARTLYTVLQKMDPRRASEVDPDNKRRIIRALEIISEIGAVPEPITSEKYDVLTLGIKTDKERLRGNFKIRAEEWLAGGFEKEVKDLLDEGVTRERLQEIGFEYLLMLEYIDGSLTEEQFVEKFIQKNWQYAKRQYTWLKRDNKIIWVDPADQEIIFSTVSEWLQR